MAFYNKECRLCYSQIEMNDRTGKWLPYSVTTGKLHQCAKPKYDRQRLYELSKDLEIVVPHLDPLNEEQEQWDKRKMKHSAKSWERWNK